MGSLRSPRACTVISTRGCVRIGFSYCGGGQRTTVAAANSENFLSIGIRSSQRVGACKIMPAVPTRTARVNIHRKSLSRTIATYFQSSFTCVTNQILQYFFQKFILICMLTNLIHQLPALCITLQCQNYKSIYLKTISVFLCVNCTQLLLLSSAISCFKAYELTVPFSSPFTGIE